MKLISAFWFSLVLFPLASMATNLQIQQRVSAVGVSDRGELQLQNNNITYRNWNSAQLPGNVRVVMHLAGRQAAQNMTDALAAALLKANLPLQGYQTTTIINADDTVIGTARFVRGRVEENQRKYQTSQFIIDNRGVVRRAWDLQAANAAFIVLDRQGRVQFLKEGALSSNDIQRIVTLLHQLLQQG